MQTPNEDEEPKIFELWGFYDPNPIGLMVMVLLSGGFSLLMQAITDINARVLFVMMVLMSVVSGMGLRLTGHRYVWLHRIIFLLIVVSFAWYKQQDNSLPPLSPFRS